MARLATTADVFNAVAEPQRRAIIGLLARGERSVGELTDRLELRQPQVSKHLGVLRKVELVRVRKEGRQRFYSLQGEQLEPIHAWVSEFEHLWNERFDRLETYLGDLQRKGERDDDSHP